MTGLMILLLGLIIASTGSAASAGLVTEARSRLAEAIARRLKGSDDSLEWINQAEQDIVSAGTATSLGMVLIGAAIPGLLGGFSSWLVSGALLLAVIPVALLGGYVIPRWFTAARPDRVAGQVTPLIRVWGKLAALVLPTRNSDHEDEIRAITHQGIAKGLGDEQLVLVGGVMSFNERPVRAIMTPRTEVVAVSDDTPLDEVMQHFAESGYTRLPVYHNDLDGITGMVHARDLLRVTPGDPLPVRSVSFAPESRRAGDLLLDMQRERQHFAVVVDEFGGTAGIVTLEDLLEGLIGEIAGEEETAPDPATEVAAGVFELEGSTPPEEVAEMLGLQLPEVEAVTFGGMLAELLGRIPLAGERLMLRGYEIDVVEASPTRVEKVLIRRGSPTLIPLDREST